jgi:hypothetical protein
LRPDPVQPNPKQPICGEELKATFALPPQDAHLMPKGDELKFQGGTTSNTEGEQGTEGRENRNHAHDVWCGHGDLYSFPPIWNFEQAQGKTEPSGCPTAPADTIVDDGKRELVECDGVRCRTGGASRSRSCVTLLSTNSLRPKRCLMPVSGHLEKKPHSARELLRRLSGHGS